MTTNPKKLFRYCLLLLCLSPFGVFAQNYITNEGVILGIDRHYVNINDMQFPLLATTKVIKQPGNKKMHLQDLKPGDYVRIKLINIAKSMYVDSINIIPQRKGLLPLPGGRPQ